MSVPEDDVEAGWVRQIAAGDRAAFERLYKRYDRRLYGYVARIAGLERAEDILADVMVEVWYGAARFSRKSRVSSWVIGIAPAQGDRRRSTRAAPANNADRHPARCSR